jgi:hypothetical protein
VLLQATERFPVDPAAFLQYAAVAERLDHLEAARDALTDYHALARDVEDADISARIEAVSQQIAAEQQKAASRRPAAADPSDRANRRR